jgi:glutamate-1-semialdehyde 2,1-aminomutase
MLNAGFSIVRSQFKAIFLSVKHEERHIETFLKVFEEFARMEH